MGNRIRRHADPLQCRIAVGIDDWLGPYCAAGEGEIWLDLGCGKGELLAALAGSHPETFFIGIEVRRRIADTFFPRFSYLPNLLLLHGNANLSIPSMMGEKKVHKILINFPDPFDHKPRYRKRQMVNRRLVEGICSILSPGGVVSVKTDRMDLFHEMDSLFLCRMKSVGLPIPGPPGPLFHTEWESECLKNSVSIFSGDYQL